MKKRILLIILISFIINIVPTYAQNLQFDTKENLAVSSPGFFAFDTESNNQFKNNFTDNVFLNVQISNSFGGPCAFAPAADFTEIGPLTILGQGGNDTTTLDFSGAPVNANLFGISIVPETSSPCIFDLLIGPPTVTSSTSSGDILIGGPGEDDILFPNGVTIFGGFLSDSITGQLTNEMSNPNCGNSPFGIEPLVINSGGGNDTINNIFNGITDTSAFATVPRTTLNKLFKDEPEPFTLTIGENKNKVNAVYNQKLINTTSMTKIFATGIFPSSSEASSNSNRKLKLDDSDIEVTLKAQLPNLIALAAVQHAVVSATMPWQLSGNGGYFITQGGGCLSPFCVIVEQGMIVVDPEGACTPEKLNKRRAGYKTFNPSKFFDPFPFASMTIQIPAANIVDPTHPLVSKVVQENAYLILQPVPPKAMIVQQLMIRLTPENDD